MREISSSLRFSLSIHKLPGALKPLPRFRNQKWQFHFTEVHRNHSINITSPCLARIRMQAIVWRNLLHNIILQGRLGVKVGNVKLHGPQTRIPKVYYVYLFPIYCDMSSVARQWYSNHAPMSVDKPAFARQRINTQQKRGYTRAETAVQRM
jgi:hypothetical protein